MAVEKKEYKNNMITNISNAQIEKVINYINQIDPKLLEKFKNNVSERQLKEAIKTLLNL